MCSLSQGFVEVLFHTFYYYWGSKNRLLYWGLSTQRFIIPRFHCSFILEKDLLVSLTTWLSYQGWVHWRPQFEDNSVKEKNVDHKINQEDGSAVNVLYCLFKIFHCFWVVKRPWLILHYQRGLTKFGRCKQIYHRFNGILTWKWGYMGHGPSINLVSRLSGPAVDLQVN